MRTCWFCQSEDETSIVWCPGDALLCLSSTSDEFMGDESVDELADESEDDWEDESGQNKLDKRLK